MVLTVDAQQRRADPIPQLARRDALRLQAHPRRRAHPRITQRDVGEFVSQDLGPLRPHADRGLFPRSLEVFVRRLRAWRILVGDDWQVGLEDGRALDGRSSHAGLLFSGRLHGLTAYRGPIAYADTCF